VSEWVSSVLRPHQHSIGYTGDGLWNINEIVYNIGITIHKEHKQDKIYNDNNRN